MNTSEQLATTRHEYRLKSWYRSLLLVLGAPAVSGGIVMGYLTYKAVNASLPLLMTALFLGFGIYLIALGMRSRVIIDGSRIEVRGAFSDRFAELSDIEGYRTISARNGKYTQIYMRNGNRALTLPNLFEHDKEFDAWFRRIPNLDERDRDVLLERISNEVELGATPQERLASLKQAKNQSILVLLVALAAAVAANWGIPALYVPFSAVLAVVPIALAFMLHRSPLLYTVFKKKEDPRAEVLYGLIVASFGLLIRARGIRFVSLHTVGLVIAILVIVYLAAFYHSMLESTSITRTFFALLLFGMLYGYGVIAVADAVGDGSAATHYVMHVIGKHYTTGRSRSYYLTLEPWGPLQQPNNLGVSKSVYDKAVPGDQVCLELRSGRLNAAWYIQVSCYGGAVESQP